VILGAPNEEDAVDDAKKALWTKVVADFEPSGQTQREFAEARQIELSRLRYGLYSLRNASRPLATEKGDPSVKADKAATRRSPSEASRMIPVRVVASTAPKARRGMVDVPSSDGLLELALPSGARGLAVACSRSRDGCFSNCVKRRAGPNVRLDLDPHVMGITDGVERHLLVAQLRRRNRQVPRRLESRELGERAAPSSASLTLTTLKTSSEKGSTPSSASLSRS
jgi:hypothetical protein